ncbi:flagellar export chaperone FliS [Sporolactobacillus putidus]|uniref:Flagellar secretion chaperone FliS n=1 Tax=Sporolactobacillus putidus TaxID=492735 RepID=A0A917S5B0_9BACL|nr:flagellar export chaperone FliS [Sporolactobacillus putidus]GGL54431.1 flagellar protein FliS [Sporolactobacillus putidus]
MPTNAYNAYQRNSVLTATQGELTLMLYNGCIKFIRQARIAMNNKDIDGKNIFLKKAQAIISELIVTVDQRHPEAGHIAALYDYIHRCLIEANVKNDPALLDEAEKHVTMFRDTWKQVIEITQKNQPKRDRA